ncbi:MAG: TolB family protein [Anaerolineae bacterium]
MTKHRILGAVLLLGAAILACASPFTAQQVDSAATAVAQTLAAIPTPPAVLPTPAPTQPPTPSPVPDVLPHSLYYLGNGPAGKLQVFRLAVDGKTVQQITFEPAAVDSFDVSPVDGSVAYGSNNQLFLVDANGAGRRLLVDGGPVDDNNRFTNSVGVPVWSPDGKTIAFSHGGLSFYSLASGAINQVLQNQIDTSAGFPIVREIYAPNRYSPDGTKLLINIGFYEAGTFGIYKPADNSLVRFNRPDGGITCCEVRWVPDGSGLYVASPTIGMVDSGLAYVDSSTGLVSVLLPGSAPDATYNFAAGPQVSTDGKLYFFFNNLPQIPTSGHTPMYLVRSETDGVTGRTKIKPDVYDNINEVLWAPDASLAGVVMGSTADMYAGGILEFVYPDARADVRLLDFAQDLHWGP